MNQAKTMFIVMFASLLVFAHSSAQAQAKFMSKANGAWESASTWTMLAGTDSDGIPDANDTVLVTGGFTVSLSGTSDACALLTIDAGSSVALTGSGNLTVNANPGTATINGTLILSGSGTLRKSGTGTRTLVVGSAGKVTISGSAPTPVFDVYSLSPTSTFEYTASANQTVQSGIVFGNLTLGGSGMKQVAPIPSDTTFRSEGTLTVATGVTFDVSTDILYIFFDGNVVIYGTLDASVGITVVVVNGAQWLNYGTYLSSVTPGFGHEPTTTFNGTVVGGSPQSQFFYDLVVNGSMTALSNFTIQRNVTISAGSTFNGGSGLTHSVGGSWTNNGTFNYGTSTILFNGTSNQNIGASTFGSVVMNDSAGFRLTGDVAIASGSTLTLSAGNIATGAFALRINSTDPGALVLGSNSITGTVTRAIAPAGTGTYNFFNANAFVIPGGTGNPSAITATVYPGINPPNLPSPTDTAISAKRYYAISAAGIGTGFLYTMRLPYAQSEVRGDESHYTMWKNDGSGWFNVLLSGPPDTVNNFVQQSGLTGFSNWMIAQDNGALPIQLASFSCTLDPGENGVLLSWVTVSEIRNYGFFVQRSATPTDGFVDLPESFKPGNGTTVNRNVYSWSDKNVPTGVYYYRLRQIDLDGAVHLTEAKEVNVAATTGVGDDKTPVAFALHQNYPNPFNPSTRIMFSVEDARYTTLKVYNVSGQEVASLFSGVAQPGTQYTVIFDGSNKPSGAYFCRLTNGDKTSLKRMILVK
jgi:hypothetical protein